MTEANYGKTNSDLLTTLTDSGAPYNAAVACSTNLNTNSSRNRGYTDWYLPADNEVSLLYVNQAAIGGFTATRWYLSTTEMSSNQVRARRMSDGNTTANKYALNGVRCVRSE